MEPLPVDLWLRKLAALSDFCEHTAADGDERLIRRAFYLAQLAPLGIQTLVMPAISLSELERMLDLGDSDAACRILVGRAPLVNVVQSETGGFVAYLS